MIPDTSAPLVIEIIKNFIALVREVTPSWQKAYLRFSDWNSVSESKASYVDGSDVQIINVLDHRPAFQNLSRLGRDLLVSMNRVDGVFVLGIDSSLDYEIKFEYSDQNKWRISKIGGTGIPEQFD